MNRINILLIIVLSTSVLAENAGYLYFNCGGSCQVKTVNRWISLIDERTASENTTINFITNTSGGSDCLSVGYADDTTIQINSSCVEEVSNTVDCPGVNNQTRMKWYRTNEKCPSPKIEINSISHNPGKKLSPFTPWPFQRLFKYYDFEFKFDSNVPAEFVEMKIDYSKTNLKIIILEGLPKEEGNVTNKLWQILNEKERSIVQYTGNSQFSSIKSLMEDETVTNQLIPFYWAFMGAVLGAILGFCLERIHGFVFERKKERKRDAQLEHIVEKTSKVEQQVQEVNRAQAVQLKHAEKTVAEMKQQAENVNKRQTEQHGLIVEKIRMLQTRIEKQGRSRRTVNGRHRRGARTSTARRRAPTR